jgi:TonB family protein
MALARAAAAALLVLAAPASAYPDVYVRQVDLPAGIVVGKERQVTAAFVSGPDGHTTACRVVGKSGEAALDEATCAILKVRGRFAPAGEQRIVFHWIAPLKPPAIESGAQRGDPLEIKRAGWISTNDYPVAAFSNGIEGEVHYDVDVSAGGKPLRCRIRRSSGSSLLDGVTCTLVMSRLIFIPAVDAQGQWREGVDHGSVTWRIG